MESKLETNDRYAYYKRILLIEPVWNRNNVTCTIQNTLEKTFNRTSMESKRAAASAITPMTFAFNRTSMESKPPHVSFLNRSNHRLLIEPVWNRNMDCLTALLIPFFLLLIEPVWNRNLCECGYLYCFWMDF